MQGGHRNTQNQNCALPCHNSDHVFLLKRISDTPAKFGVCVDFSATSCATLTHPSSSSLPTFPIFNNDRRHYTPAFILPDDQPKFDQNAQLCLASHQRKVKEFQDEKEQIFLPKPSLANRFCMICKEAFDDYLTHLAKPSHKQLLQQSTFYEDVLTLCDKFGSKVPKNIGKKIKKGKKFETPSQTCPKKTSKRGQKSMQSSSTGIQSQQSQQNSLLVNQN